MSEVFCSLAGEDPMPFVFTARTAGSGCRQFPKFFRDLRRSFQTPSDTCKKFKCTLFDIFCDLFATVVNKLCPFCQSDPGVNTIPWICFGVFFSYFAISVFKLKSNYSIAEYQIVGLTVFCKLSACSSRATHSFCTKNLNFEMRCLNDKLCQAYKKVKYRESRVKLWCKRCKRAYNKHQSIYYVYKFHWTV